VFINGDGETSRDFCFVENVVQANILAACTENHDAVNTVYNIAYGGRAELNELFYAIRKEVVGNNPAAVHQEPIYRDFRAGDIRNSLAGIGKAQRLLGYEPKFPASTGLEKAAKWYQLVK
jgi:UDP-N-acetylglucosamine/UDP-N-acetylgalactosamine 4-epimerase